VIEMDAASNNSVDDIRELREGVAYAPVSGRTKVYILDEAHMLSTAAWNAFLKTLEEPPPNTVFVLATTEAQKVPPTVVDRCQRFDFHRPGVEQIARVVERVAAAESIEIPPPAVAALARSATGSFRDALGTLEQLVAYSGEEIALEDVLAVLGRGDPRELEETVDAVAAGDAGRALRKLAECLEHGRDAAVFASDLEVRLRELLVVQTLDEVPGELALTPEADQALRAQARRVEHATVVGLLELLGAAMEGVRAGADPRTRVELALVKAARPELDPSVRALLARIERLESRPRPADEAGDDDDDEEPPQTASASAVSSQAVGERTSEQVESLRGLWPAVVDLVRAKNALLGALIAEAEPIALDGEELTVAFAASAQFLKKKAEDPANRATVSEALGELTGRRLRLSYELREELEVQARGGPARGSGEELVRRFMEEFDAEELPIDCTPERGEQPISEERGV
jgi:DNA polymerase-3 subunit gamma/tau